MRIVVTAESLDEAKRKLHARISEQMMFENLRPEVFREEVLFNDTKTVTAFGETVDTAVDRTRGWLMGIPTEAKAVDTKTSPPGDSRTEIVQAFDEEGAKLQLRDKFGGDLLIDSVSQEGSGRKGFLWIRRTASTYVATVRPPAVANVTYKFARVSAFLFHRESPGPCWVCGCAISKGDIQKAMDGAEEDYVPRVCDGCGEWVCWWCAYYLLAPAAVPTGHTEKIKNKLVVNDGMVWHFVCDGRVRTFKSLIDQAAQKESGTVCSSCNKTISADELQPDKLGRITQQLFSDVPLAKYGVTVGHAMKCRGCGEWICAKCAEKAALAAGAGALNHANCGGMFETVKP